MPYGPSYRASTLDKEALIRLVLAQTDTIAALNQEVEMLTSRLSRLETDNASLRAENAGLREKRKFPGQFEHAALARKEAVWRSGCDRKGRRTTHPLHPNVRLDFAIEQIVGRLNSIEASHDVERIHLRRRVVADTRPNLALAAQVLQPEHKLPEADESWASNGCFRKPYSRAIKDGHPCE